MVKSIIHSVVTSSGPDATENYACEQASIKAKKEIIQKVSPEVLSAKTTRQCV